MKKKIKFDLSKIDNSIYPDDVLIDNEMDEKIKNFFKNNNMNIVNTNENILDSESESEIFINNNYLKFENENNIYEELKINNDFINEVLSEYEIVKDKILKLNIEKKNELIISKKNYNISPFPNDYILKTRILGFKSNKKCMKQILTIKNIIFSNNNINNINLTKLYQWIYTFLLLLDTPLIDSDNSILYDLNKKIYLQEKNTNNNNIYLKIIFIIISKIFNQKINY